MLTIALFFILGAALGLIGTRLIARWDTHPPIKTHIDLLHRRR